MRQSMYVGKPPPIAPRTNSNPNLLAPPATSAQPQQQQPPPTVAARPAARKAAAAPVVKKINAKERVKLAHDSEIDDDTAPISFGRAVHRLEEGLKALLTAAHNSVLNPSYNYDNRTQAAITYLHQATRGLIKVSCRRLLGCLIACAVCRCLSAKSPRVASSRATTARAATTRPTQMCRATTAKRVWSRKRCAVRID